jgi:ABC-type sugar transport system ATPase subunit
VFQSPALYPHLSVFANLEFGLKARGLPRTQRRERVREVAEMLDVEQLLERRPAQLSGGERQRVALGRAVARKPAILLLDEPFSNLDHSLRSALRAEVVKLHERFGSTVVHVTHDQSEALCLGQQLAVLHEGRLMQLDAPRSIYTRPAHRFVASFVGEPGMNLIEIDVTHGDSTLRISTPGGAISMDYPAETDRVSFPPSQPGTRRLLLGIRPEWVSLSPEPLTGPGPPEIPRLEVPAIIQGIEYQGSTMLFTLQVDGQTLLSREPSFRQFQAGEQVFAWFALWHACWFDPASGSRLEFNCQRTPDAIA